MTGASQVCPIIVKMTETMGRGVFAARIIRAGEVLGRFHTLHLPAGEVEMMAEGSLSNFWFEDADGSAVIVLGWIELVNHAPAPNTGRAWETTSEGEVVTVFALRDISAGEQLFIDYKFEGLPDEPAWALAPSKQALEGGT